MRGLCEAVAGKLEGGEVGGESSELEEEAADAARQLGVEDKPLGQYWPIEAAQVAAATTT